MPPRTSRAANFGLSALAFVLAVSSARSQIDESAALDSIRTTYNLPGLSVIAVKNGRIVAQGASGIRRVGHSSPLLVTDQLNFASCTKFMTGTLAARLVDKGHIQWNTRIRDVFPGYASFHSSFHNVTLRDLLAHRAGVQEQPTFDSRHWNNFMAVSGSIADLRSWVVQRVLLDPPDVAYGTYLYSNLGYTVAARMMETSTGKSWEQLIEEEIFSPLRLKDAGFGIVFSGNLPPVAPVGHDLANGSTTPVVRTIPSQAALLHHQASIAAGGFVSCPLATFAKFLLAHASGENGSYLTSGSREQLLTPWTGSEGYAMGVSNVSRWWAEPGRAFAHSGDIFGHNTVFWIAPAHDFITIAFTNCRSYDSRVPNALDQAVGRMVSLYRSASPSGALLETPENLSFTRGPGTFTLTAKTLPGVTYQLQRSNSLGNGSWENGTSFEAVNWISSLTVFPSQPTKEFFRFRTVP